MICWQGVDIHTRERVVIWDSPLRIVLGWGVVEPAREIPADHVSRMAIATSANLGTAAVIVIDDAVLVEAAPDSAMAGRTYMAALRAAHLHLESETNLERAWNDESAYADELIARIRARTRGGSRY